MAGRQYEISVVGRLGPVLLARFPEMRSAVIPKHSIVRVPAADFEDLIMVIDRLHRAGCRFVRIHACHLDPRAESTPHGGDTRSLGRSESAGVSSSPLHDGRRGGCAWPRFAPGGAGMPGVQ